MMKEYSLRVCWIRYDGICNGLQSVVDTNKNTKGETIWETRKMNLEEARSLAKEYLTKYTKEAMNPEDIHNDNYAKYCKIYKGRTCVEKIEL